MIRSCSRLTPSIALKAVPALLERYPLGGEWLERRLGDVASGHARIIGIPIGNELAAISIETPKGWGRRKLSTFGVAPRWRSLGLGTALLNALRWDWIQEGIEKAYVTVDHMDLQTCRFFLNHGFAEAPDVIVPYGANRFDRLMTWSAVRDSLSATPFH